MQTGYLLLNRNAPFLIIFFLIIFSDLTLFIPVRLLFWLLFWLLFCSYISMLNFEIFLSFFLFFAFFIFFLCSKMYSKKQPAKPAAVRHSLYAASFTASSFLVSPITPSFLSSLSRYFAMLSYVLYVYLMVISL